MIIFLIKYFKLKIMKSKIKKDEIIFDIASIVFTKNFIR